MAYIGVWMCVYDCNDTFKEIHKLRHVRAPTMYTRPGERVPGTAGPPCTRRRLLLERCCGCHTTTTTTADAAETENGDACVRACEHACVRVGDVAAGCAIARARSTFRPGGTCTHH